VTGLADTVKVENWVLQLKDHTLCWHTDIRKRHEVTLHLGHWTA